MNGNPQTLQVMLVDDHTLFREGLRRMLDAEAGFAVCADFASAGEARRAVTDGLQFDVALVDYELLDEPVEREPRLHRNGLALVEEILRLRPEARVLLVTAGMEIAHLMRAVQVLGAGVFLKTEPIAELTLAIRRTAKGRQWISSGAALELLAGHPAPERHEAMSERESLVLRGVLEGMSNKEIGAQLELSESAVKAVLQKLFQKTGVRSRSQLVRHAIETQIA